MTVQTSFGVLAEFKRRSVSGNPWFAGLPEPIIDTLIGAARTRTLPAGALLHARGDEPDGCYGVVSGAIRISATAVDGRRISLAIFGPGSWFGEISMIDNLPRTHDAHACGPAKLMIVPAATIRELMDRDPSVFRHFAKLVCQRIRTMFATLEDQMFAPLPLRLARRLLMLAETYGGPSSAPIRLPLAQENIASILGVTRQAANAALRDFQDRGLIELGYGWIRIEDVPGLRVVGASG